MESGQGTHWFSEVLAGRDSCSTSRTLLRPLPFRQGPRAAAPPDSQAWRPAVNIARNYQRLTLPPVTFDIVSQRSWRVRLPQACNSQADGYPSAPPAVFGQPAVSTRRAVSRGGQLVPCSVAAPHPACWLYARRHWRYCLRYGPQAPADIFSPIFFPVMPLCTLARRVQAGGQQVQQGHVSAAEPGLSSFSHFPAGSRCLRSHMGASGTCATLMGQREQISASACAQIILLRCTGLHSPRRLVASGSGPS